MATLEKVCRAVGDVVDFIRFGDDLGMDTGPFMSPEVYQRLFKPRHTILCRYVKQNSRMHTFLHSCGSIYRLLPDLIEAGYEVFNPVQTNTRDMEPERLKKRVRPRYHLLGRRLRYTQHPQPGYAVEGERFCKAAIGCVYARGRLRVQHGT